MRTVSKIICLRSFTSRHIFCGKPHHHVSKSCSAIRTRSLHQRHNDDIQIIINSITEKYKPRKKGTNVVSDLNVCKDLVCRLQNEKIGNLKSTQVREADQALSSLAHITDAKALVTRGELSWDIVRRVLEEEGMIDNTTGTFCISGNPRLIDTMICHNAIKCMAQSTNFDLYEKSNELAKTIEENFIHSKSNLRTIGRTYSILIDSMHDLHMNDGNDIVDRVKDILRRVDEQQHNGNNDVELNKHIYNAALNTLSAHTEASHEAFQMVQDMISKEGAPLDHISFSIAIKAILSSPFVLDSSDSSNTIVENVLIKMESLGLGHPNQKTMTPILAALSKRGNFSGIVNLLDWMEHMFNTRGWTDIRPNRFHFNSMITSLSRGKTRNCGDQALKLLDKMNAMYKSGDNENLEPDLVTYNAVLHCIAKDRDSNDSKHSKSHKNNSEKALRLLTQMNEMESITPDLVSYNTVLSSFINSAFGDAPKKSLELLEHMADIGIEPDLLSYTIVINILARSHENGSAEKAEELLNELIASYESGASTVMPDLKCFNSVIYALANSSETDSINRAFRVLEKMKELKENGTRPDLIPDAVTYTSLISALSRSDRKSNESLIDKVTSLIQGERDLKLDSGVYNALIHAQSRGAELEYAEKAEKMLRLMLQSEDKQMAKPNTITFNSVIHAYSQSKHRDAPMRAESLLHEMQTLHQNGYPTIAPDAHSFASVLNAYANSNDPHAAEKADRILKHMQQLQSEGENDIQVNTVCCATVIKAYSRSRTLKGAYRAEEILDWMIEEYQSGMNADLKPNTICFTSVCEAWAQSKAPESVEKVKSLISRMNEIDITGLSPNAYTYNSLLTAISRSKDSKKALKAVEVLDFMKKERNLNVNSFSYSIVLNACSYTNGSNDERYQALKVAIAVLEEAIRNATPHDRLNVLYGSFFQACANLTPTVEEKMKIQRVIRTVFEQCCEKGQIDSKLIHQVRKACSHRLFHDLFGHFPTFPTIDEKDIPLEWKKNVIQKKAKQ